MKAPVRFSFPLAEKKDLKTFPCLALFLSAALLNLTFARWVSHVLKGNEISAVLLLLPAQINNVLLNSGNCILAFACQRHSSGEAWL